MGASGLIWPASSPSPRPSGRRTYLGPSLGAAADRRGTGLPAGGGTPAPARHPNRGDEGDGCDAGPGVPHREGHLERSGVDTLAAYLQALGGKLKIAADCGDESCVPG